MLASIIIVVAVAVLLGLAAFGWALASSSRKQYKAQGEVIPGQPSAAPASWAGAHTPEARMHRRLGEAIRALRAVADTAHEDIRLLELRVELEQQALAVDQRLIVAAALPTAVRGPALERAEAAVAAVEQATGMLAAQAAMGSQADERGLEDLVERIRFAGEVRGELDALEGMALPPVDRPDEEGTAQPGTA